MLKTWTFKTRGGEVGVQYQAGNYSEQTPDTVYIATDEEHITLDAFEMDQIATTWLAMRKAEGEANRSDVPF